MNIGATGFEAAKGFGQEEGWFADGYVVEPPNWFEEGNIKNKVEHAAAGVNKKHTRTKYAFCFLFPASLTADTFRQAALDFSS